MTRDQEIIRMVNQRIDDLECKIDEKMMLIGGGQKERMDRMEKRLATLSDEVSNMKTADSDRVSQFQGARLFATGLFFLLTWIASIFGPDIRAALAKAVPVEAPAHR